MTSQQQSEKRYDLHTHTTASDGMHTPAEQVELASQAGLAGIAITDHDTLGGLKEAAEAGEKWGIEIIPGVEISTVQNGKDIHVLGYWIQPDDNVLKERLQGLRDARQRRNHQIIRNLQQAGIAIELADVRKAAGKEDDTIGRPHIADALVQLGVVQDMREAFDLYLAEGAKAYAQVERISPYEALTWIHEAGGVAVLAHPGLYQDDELVEQIVSTGMDGLEVRHSDHTGEDEDRYTRLADKLKLIQTAGSDFHGSRQGKIFHGPLGNRYVTAPVLQQLRQLRKIRQR
ncbi:PHP domain-containing protein [Marinicrinis sediminis]|uniref:PHP domain-containing protein n=1 Tax=Marinicrinis sediminis TaxID=1652465 RepID=A0ABW5R5A5_9BACL